MTSNKFKLTALFSLLLTLTLAFSLAASAESSVVQDQNEGTVVKAILVKDGVEKEISLEELEDIKTDSLRQQKNMVTQKQNFTKNLNNNVSALSDVSPMVITDMSYYVESNFIRNVYRWSLNRRISAPVYNSSPTTTNSRTISYSTTQSYTSNFSFSTSGQRSAITAGVTAGASWSNSESVTDSVTQNIPPLKYSWMDYTPLMDNSFGILYERVWNIVPGWAELIVDEDRFIDLYIMKRTGAGIPDGLYTIVESSNYPTY